MMSDQLTDTVAAFQQWRTNKPARSSATPSHLRKQAVALLPHYSQSTIATALRISGSQLKHWRLAHQELNDTTHFIPLPSLQSEPLPLVIPSLSFEVSLTNGNQFSVSGAVDCQLITHLIEAIRS